MWGCPNIWGHLNIQKGIQTYRGHPNIWGHMDPLSLIKHAFFVLCMYRGIQTTSKLTEGHPNIWGMSKHTGGIQTNVGMSNHMEGIQTYGGVQTYRGHSCMPSYPAKQVLPLVQI